MEEKKRDEHSSPDKEAPKPFDVEPQDGDEQGNEPPPPGGGDPQGPGKKP